MSQISTAAESANVLLDGSLQARILVQVAMAATFAALHAVKDMRVRRPPRFWSAPSLHRPSRPDLWPNLGKLLLLGLALDAFCQAILQGVGSAVEAPLIALAVAVPLYVVLRLLILWAASKLRTTS